MITSVPGHYLPNTLIILPERKQFVYIENYNERYNELCDDKRKGESSRFAVF